MAPPDFRAEAAARTAALLDQLSPEPRDLAETLAVETLSQETLDRIAAAEILDGFDVLVRDVAIEQMVDDDLAVLTEVAKHSDPRTQVWELRRISAELAGIPFNVPAPAPETDLNRAWREKERQRIAQIMDGGTRITDNAYSFEGITPIPRTQEDVEALIATLVPGLSPIVIGSTTDMAIAGLASLRLDLALAEPFLVEIKKRTGTPIGGLRDLLGKKLAAITGQTASRAMSTSTADVIKKRYIHIKEIGSFWDTKARTVLRVRDVCDAHWSEMPFVDEYTRANPFDVLIKDEGGAGGCRHADRFEFRPGAPEFFDDDRGCKALNIWVKPTLVPFDGDAALVDIGPLERHAEYILNGDAVVIKHQFDYLAHLVQKPWIKIKNTILLIGPEGVGKTFFAEMMIRILGKDNVAFIDSSNLESVFNGYMDGKLLVVVNELVGLDKKSMNRLKAYITDAKMTINRKNIPTYDYDSFANFLLYSNYDDAARISEGDRRFCIEKSKAQPREPAYYNQLWAWFAGGGDAHFLRFLQDRDLSAFNPYAPPPITAAKLDIVADSRDHLTAYFQDAFDTGDAPFRHDLVSVNQIATWLNKERGMRVTHMQVTKFLRSIDAEWLGQRSIRDRQRAIVWAIRNATEWGAVGDSDIKNAWRDVGEVALGDDQRKRLLGRI